MSQLATLITLISLLAGGLFSAVNAEAATTRLPSNPGELIRGTTLPAVYYVGRDGFRYVFTNELIATFPRFASC